MENNTFILKGFVKSYSGNQMNINEAKEIVKKSYKLLVVEGIHKHYGSSDFDITLSNLDYKIIKTKVNGEFYIELNKGFYTFFILKDDKAYLNNFDGAGNYSHIEVKDNINNFIIRDYQKAYF